VRGGQSPTGAFRSCCFGSNSAVSKIGPIMAIY
jgi:hypothetical protein